MKKLFDEKKAMLEEVTFSDKVVHVTKTEEPVKTIPIVDTKVGEVVNPELNAILQKKAMEFIQEKAIEKGSVVYFKLGCKHTVNIDKSGLIPSNLVFLSGSRFESIYMKELESILYSGNNKLNTDKLLGLIYLYDMIKAGKYPTTLITSKYKKFNGYINRTLNAFMNNNLPVIKSMYGMFNSEVEKTKDHA